MWQGSSVGQSMRFIPAASRVRISPLLPQCIYPRMSLQAPGSFFVPSFLPGIPLAPDPAIPAAECSQKPPASPLCAQARRARLPGPELCSSVHILRPYINDTASREPRIPYATPGLPEEHKVCTKSRAHRLSEVRGPERPCQQTRLASRLLHRAAVMLPAPSRAEGQVQPGARKTQPARSPDICARHACLKLWGMH